MGLAAASHALPNDKGHRFGVGLKRVLAAESHDIDRAPGISQAAVTAIFQRRQPQQSASQRGFQSFLDRAALLVVGLKHLAINWQRPMS